MAFRSVKFCPDDKKLTAFTKRVFILADLHNGMTQEAINAWVAEHKLHVSQLLNKKRTYVAKQMHDALKIVLRKSWSAGEKLPAPSEIVRCAKRNLDLSIPAGSALAGSDPTAREIIELSKDGWLFFVYWDWLLPKAAGNKTWSTNFRHFFTITDAPFHHDRKYKL